MRSISKAAEALNIALSAASRRLRLLEQEAGTRLIARRPHGVEPTAAGITMMNYARDVLSLGDKLQVNLNEHRSGIRGYVRISASSSVLVQRLARDLSHFVRANPQIKVDLEERPSEATIAAVVSKQADVGIIVRQNQVEGDLEMVEYSGDHLAVAVPEAHRFAKRRQLSFKEILGEDMIVLESGTATNRLLTVRARELGRPMKTRVHVRSFEVMCLMINEGLGIGILPELAARPLSKTLNIKLVRLVEPWAQRQYAICVRSIEKLEPPSSRLVAFLERAATQHAQGDSTRRSRRRSPLA